MSHSPEPHLAAIRPSLERELAGQVQPTWGDEAVRAPVCDVTHETARPLALVEMGFLQTCHDASGSLLASELADSIWETRARAQRFRVFEAGGMVSIRSTALCGAAPVPGRRGAWVGRQATRRAASTTHAGASARRVTRPRLATSGEAWQDPRRPGDQRRTARRGLSQGGGDGGE